MTFIYFIPHLVLERTQTDTFKYNTIKLIINKKNKWMRENKQEIQFERDLKRSKEARSNISLRNNCAAVSCVLARSRPQSGPVLLAHDTKIKPDQLNYSSCPSDEKWGGRETRKKTFAQKNCSIPDSGRETSLGPSWRRHDTLHLVAFLHYN